MMTLTMAPLDAEQGSTSHGVFDLCVIGGGIAGTTAAIFASKLGLRTLIVESGDWLHGLTPITQADDSAPVGGAPSGSAPPRSPAGLRTAERAIQSTHSAEGIETWKQLLLGGPPQAWNHFEVTRLEAHETGHGCWVWGRQRRNGEEGRVLARAVLIATGRASPRSIDAPSMQSPDTPGGDLDAALGRPALVIGEGAEAVAAVIQISNWKSRAHDQAGVYWASGRGPDEADSETPPEGLGDAFLQAWIRNQNIHRLPDCEILGPIAGPRGEERFGVRQGRKEIAGRPDEVVLYEFERDCVLDFIDRASLEHASLEKDDAIVRASSRSLIDALGLRRGAAEAGDLLLVDGSGRSSQPGVYLAGDALGEAYLHCESFEDVANARRFVRGKGGGRGEGPELCILEAIRAVEAIAESRGLRSSDGSDTGASPRAHESSAEANASGPGWALRLLSPDGSVTRSIAIHSEITEIGREGTDVAIPDDPHLALHHASLVEESGELFIADTGAGSGVWLRVGSSEGMELENEDQVWIGSQILVALKHDDSWSLIHYGEDGRARQTYAIGDDGLFVGRGSEVGLSAEDPLLSRRHAQFLVESGRLRVYDRGARNGTFVKITSAVALSAGDEFRMATQCFRLDAGGGEASSISERDAARDAARKAAEEAEPSVVSQGSQVPGSVRFDDESHPAEFSIGPGKTILQGFIESGGQQGAPLSWECQTGACGLCAVEIVSGQEFFEAIEYDSSELKTIEQTTGIAARQSHHRLACLSCVRGPVVLRRLDSQKRS